MDDADKSSMKWLSLFVTLFLVSCSTIDESKPFAKRAPASFTSAFDYSRCTKATDADSAAYIVEDLDLNEDKLNEEFEKMYKSPKRISQRVFYDTNLKSFVVPYGPQSFAIPSRILESVSAHVQEAIDNQYARFIFFADMGHGHIFLPKSFSSPSFGEIIYAEDIKVVYHTAEMMFLGSNGQREADPYLQWRFQNKNLVGDLLTGELSSKDISDSEDNVLRSIPGYKEQAIFYFRASPNGCFTYDYEGKRHYFDIRF